LKHWSVAVPALIKGLGYVLGFFSHFISIRAMAPLSQYRYRGVKNGTACSFFPCVSGKKKWALVWPLQEGIVLSLHQS